MGVNKRLLTVEDANSIVGHFGKGFMDYYELDTRSLDTTNLLLSYDFIELYVSEDSFRFTIANSLWTGGYFIRDSDGSDVSVDIEDNIITVTGTDLTYVVLVLELSPEFKYDDYVELEFNPVYTPVVRPFYEDIPLSMVFVDNDSLPVDGLSLTDNMTGETITTDENGYIQVDSPIDEAGDFDYSITGTQSGTDVDYNFPFSRVKVELPVVIVSDNIIKDKKQEISFKFLFDGDYQITEDMLFTNNNIVLHCNNKEYTVESVSDNVFTFFVDLEDYVQDYINLKLNVSGNDYLKDSVFNFYEELNYFTCNNVADLKSEIEDVNGTDTVYYTGTDIDDVIYISRDVEIIFSDSVINSTNTVPFTVSDGATLILNGLIFTGLGTVVSIESGNLECRECYFANIPDIVIKAEADSTINIKDSSFMNNTNCISSDGAVTLYNTEFTLNDKYIISESEVAFVKSIQEFNLDYCTFNVDLQDLTSISFGYVFFFIGRNTIVNGVNSSNLTVNESFNFKKCTSDVHIETSTVIFTSKFNKTVLWTVEDTNTLYSNELEVEYV